MPITSSPLSADKDVTWPAKLEDISAGGIGLVLTRRFELGTTLLVDFAPSRQQPGCRLLVRVARVVALAGRRWLLGCAFARKLDEEEVQDLL